MPGSKLAYGATVPPLGACDVVYGVLYAESITELVVHGAGWPWGREIFEKVPFSAKLLAFAVRFIPGMGLLAFDSLPNKRSEITHTLASSQSSLYRELAS
eukprot:3941188-Rhodomonas_salina.7